MSEIGVLEWRHYEAVPGRRDALLARFRDGTLALFADHGFRVLAFGVDVEDENSLCYLLAWSSEEEMREGWKTFVGDPRWTALRDVSEERAPLIASITKRVLHDAALG
jgi:hypothetical protein